MYRLTTSFIILSVLALGFLSLVDAEEFSWEVPFEYGRSGCDVFYDGELPLAQCYMEGVRDFEPDVQWDEHTKTYIPTIQMEEEALAEYEVFLEVQRNKLTPEERTILELKEIQERRQLTQSESQLLAALEKMGAVCKGDILTIQTYEEWGVPTEEWTDPITGEKSIHLAKDYSLVSINLQNHYLLKMTLLAVEKCIAQNTLSEYLTPSYENKVVDDYTDPAPYHADFVTSEYEYDEYFVAPLDFEQQGLESKYIICSNSLYSVQFKEQSGCDMSYLYLVDPSVKITENYDYENHQLIQELNNYKDNGDAHQLKTVQQKNLDKYKERHE